MSSPEDQGQGPVIRDRRRIDPATGQVREPGKSGSQPGPGPQRGPAGSGPRRGPDPAPDGQPGPATEGPPGSQPRPGRHSASTPGGQPANGSERAADGGPAGQSGTPGDAGRGNDPAGGQTARMLAERTADLQRLQAEYANYRKRVERDRQAVREQALASVLSELLPVLDDIGRAREHGELSGGFKSVADSLESIAGKLGLTAYGEPGDPFDPTLHEALMHEYSADVLEPTCVKILQPGYKVGDRIVRPARVAVAEPGADDGGNGTPDGAGDDDAAQAGD
jgi:molecular chaperone GrpE